MGTIKIVNLMIDSILAAIQKETDLNTVLTMPNERNQMGHRV